MNATYGNVARERILRLLDEGSFVELFESVVSRKTDLTIKDFSEDSDGVVTGYGLMNGRLVFLYSQNPNVLGGSLGEMHCKKIVQIYSQALKMGAPVIAMLDSTGMRLQEGADVMEGFGEVISAANEVSGIIPTFSVIYGTCGGGLSIIPALSDFTYMYDNNGRLFVNSPNAVDGNYIEKLDTSSGEFKAAYSGIVDEVLDENEIAQRITSLLTFLPANNTEGILVGDCKDDLNRLLQITSKEQYDARVFVQDLADANIFIETKVEYGKDLLTGFIQLNGMTIGVIANQTQDGRLSVDALEKGKDFIRFIDNYDIPLLTLIDVCGFEASLSAEKSLSRAMAGFVSAISDADVPKVTLIPKRAYGTASIIMASKAIGADFVYAWEDAQMGIMPSDMAQKVLKDAEIDYDAKHNGASNFAKRAVVDRIIKPENSRKYLVSAFDLLYTKYSCVQDKKHSLR